MEDALGHTRDLFRTALAIDDATWARSRGWVLSQAVGALSYYTLDTNPELVREGERWLAEGGLTRRGGGGSAPASSQELDLRGLCGRGVCRCAP